MTEQPKPADAALLRSVCYAVEHPGGWLSMEGCEKAARIRALADEIETLPAMEGALEDAADLLDKYVAKRGTKMSLAGTLRVYAKRLAAFSSSRTPARVRAGEC
jgi:hypothetical protein